MARVALGEGRGRRPAASVVGLLLALGLAREVLELLLAHPRPGLLAFALALELGAHEPALLLALGWHRSPPVALTVPPIASRAHCGTGRHRGRCPSGTVARCDCRSSRPSSPCSPSPPTRCPRARAGCSSRSGMASGRWSSATATRCSSSHEI